MAKTRVKKTVITGVTSEQAEAALREFSKADARIQKLTSDKELKLIAIRDKYDAEIAEQTERMKESEDILQALRWKTKRNCFPRLRATELHMECSDFAWGSPRSSALKVLLRLLYSIWLRNIFPIISAQKKAWQIIVLSMIVRSRKLSINYLNVVWL